MATKNKGAGRVAWSSEQFNLFVKICIREQLRHKWDWMKDQWKMWKALKGNETGLGWDPIKGTVVAPDEWWNKKIKENLKFARFREKGIGQELYENYQELFLGTVATGEFAYAPSSGLKETIKETMESKTATMCSLLGDRPGCSIEEVMKDVLTLPLIEKGSDIHFFCTLLLDQKSKREMYNTLEDAETKWKWLQFHFSLWTNGVWKPST
ncbi:hypothetical protein P3X46_034174 [Hevea brasiliensis]|uniref:Myb/SANT-like domain-containing protein n=1 Tax=Hevea brasiliensis TaxID=3981 RepID=A0ABQ9K8R8_HEVBR|nr:hypothetical protein P3X46_034174 [Hevea brasiliensis]